MIRLVQMADGAQRCVALVDEPKLRLLEGVDSVHALAHQAMASGAPLSSLARQYATGAAFDYDEIYDGRSPWRLLPPIDHPQEPSRCVISGTGLTHVGSAHDRHAMHDARRDAPTDSLRMFEEGLAGGRPLPGAIGAPPEW